MVLAGVASLLVLAVIAGLVALDQRGKARAEATAAAAQGLGAQALAEPDLDRALLLARQGMALDDTLETRSNLLATLLKSPAAIGVLRGDGDGLTSLALSPDGRTLAFVDTDGTLQPDRYRHAAARWRPRRSYPTYNSQVEPALQRRRLAARGRRWRAGHPRRSHAARARSGWSPRRFIYGPALLARRAHAVRRSSTPIGPVHSSSASTRAAAGRSASRVLVARGVDQGRRSWSRPTAGAS